MSNKLWDGISSIIKEGESIKSDRFTYTIEKLINQGQSVTYKAKRDDGKAIFLKHIRNPNSKSKEWKEYLDFQNTVLTKLLLLPHTIVEINYENFIYGGKFKYLFQAKAFENGMSLREFIDEENRLNTTQKFELATIITGIIRQIHKIGIIHTDLKPEQIFLVKDSKSSLGFRPKIMDFDHCIVVDKYYKPAGTDIWQSPEHLRNETIDFKSDVFTMGLIIFYIFTNGGTPFNVDTYEQDAKIGKFRSLHDIFQTALPKEFIDVLESTLHPDKNKRPSIDELFDALLKLKNGEYEKKQNYIYLISNGKKAIITDNKVITREFVKSVFKNHQSIYLKQFEFIKQDDEWFIKGFEIPKTVKGKDGKTYTFYNTIYNGVDITNKLEKVVDNGVIKVGNVEFITRIV